MRGRYTNVYGKSNEVENTRAILWAILVDQECTGIQDTVPAIVAKKLTNGRQSVDKRRQNSKVASNRVIIENYLGWLCYFNIIGGKGKWAKDKYKAFLQLGMALTIAHVIHHPLRAEDQHHYTCILNRLVFTGSEQQKMRSSTQLDYRNRRRQHVSHNMGDEEAPNSGIEDSIFPIDDKHFLEFS